MNCKWTIPLISKKVTSIIFICDFKMQASFELFMPFKNTWLFQASLQQASRALHKFHLHSFLISHKINVDSLLYKPIIFVIKCRNTCFISATTSTQVALMCINYNWWKLKHAQICLFCDQVTWFHLCCAIKLFRELHSHNRARSRVCVCTLELLAAGSCEHSNEPSDSIKGTKFLD
jgi:hypothetical protein